MKFIARHSFPLLTMTVFLWPCLIFAGSWRCQFCGLVINTDPRDSGYLQRLIQIHLNTCPQRYRATPPPPPNPLPGLMDKATQIHRRLMAIEGINLPSLGDPTSLDRLDTTLTRLLAAVQLEIFRCQRDRDSFSQDSTAALREWTRWVNHGIEIEEQNAQLNKQIAQNQLDFQREQAAISSADGEITHLEKNIAELDAAVFEIRNRVFRRLQKAQEQGWILPPSSYREVPSPLPVVTASIDVPAQRAELAQAAAPVGHPAKLAEAKSQTTNTQASEASAAGTESSIKNKLALLEGRVSDLRKAAGERAQTLRSLKNISGERDREARSVERLERSRDELNETLASGKQKLTRLKEKSAELAGQLADERTKAIYEWIQWGISRALDQRTEELMKEAFGHAVNPDLLFKIRDVATTSVQLFSDTMGVIKRFPQAMAGHGESLDGLQRDLDEAKHRFGLDFISTYTDIPGPALPYLTKKQ